MVNFQAGNEKLCFGFGQKSISGAMPEEVYYSAFITIEQEQNAGWVDRFLKSGSIRSKPAVALIPAHPHCI